MDPIADLLLVASCSSNRDAASTDTRLRFAPSSSHGQDLLRLIRQPFPLSQLIILYFRRWWNLRHCGQQLTSADGLAEDGRRSFGGGRATSSDEPAYGLWAWRQKRRWRTVRPQSGVWRDGRRRSAEQGLGLKGTRRTRWRRIRTRRRVPDSSRGS